MTCNSGTLVGTIVSDITRKVVNENMVIVSFRVAPCNAREGDSPIPVTAYNEQAERLFNRSNKGDTMSFSFRLRYVTWMTQEENPQPRSRMEVIAYSSDMIRLGQLSTQLRAEAAAGTGPNPEPVDAEPIAQPIGSSARDIKKAIKKQSPTMVTELNEVPF